MGSAGLRTRYEAVIVAFLGLCGLLSAWVVALVLLLIVRGAIPFFQAVPLGEFLTGTQWTPLFSEKHFGILPLISGTALTSGIGLLVAIPTGILLALFMNEYLSERWRPLVKSVLEVLAFVPTIVYGYFALVLLTPLLQKWIAGLQVFNALSAGLVMGLMLLPIFTSVADDAIRAVPISLREAGYGLGASTFQVAFRIVLPAARDGILAGFLLALVRALGETMLVTVAAGQVPNLTMDPREPVLTLTAYIVQVAMGDIPEGSIAYYSVYGVALVLFVLVGLATVFAFRFRRKVQSA